MKVTNRIKCHLVNGVENTTKIELEVENVFFRTKWVQLKIGDSPLVVVSAYDLQKAISNAINNEQ